MSILGMAAIAAGGLLLIIAAWGVIVLPDALSRQHAATKAGTLALALICAGAWLLQPEWSWGWRLLLIIGFLMVTLPVASHLLARAAQDRGEKAGSKEAGRCQGGERNRREEQHGQKACGEEDDGPQDGGEGVPEVECHPHSEGNDTQRCLARGIQVTPTWLIERSGEEVGRLEGARPPDELAAFSGCPYGPPG